MPNAKNDIGSAKKIIKNAINESVSNLTIFKSLEIIKNYGLPVSDYGFSPNKEDVISVAKRLGFPIAMKLVSEKGIHKSDVGGIVLNISNEEDALKSFSKIKKDAKRSNVDFQGVVLQKMFGIGKETQEIIIGSKKDPQFGQTIAFGLGGIFVEIFEDISFRVVPINKKDALEMMKETKGYKILNGYRGKKYYTKGLEKLLMKTSKLLEENPEISELDFNPVMVSEKTLSIVDARIILEIPDEK